MIHFWLSLWGERESSSFLVCTSLKFHRLWNVPCAWCGQQRTICFTYHDEGFSVIITCYKDRYSLVTSKLGYKYLNILWLCKLCSRFIPCTSVHKAEKMQRLSNISISQTSVGYPQWHWPFLEKYLLRDKIISWQEQYFMFPRWKRRNV